MTHYTKGEQTRARVIREARELIIANGFKGTSISQIIDHTGVKKGALYFHFANKDELGYSILQDARDEFFGFLERSLAGDSPLQKVHSFLSAILDQQKNQHFVGGCLFGNTALEMSDSNERFGALILSVFTGWIDRLAGLLEEARQGGELDRGTNPLLLAKTMVAAIEGGIMMARLSKNRSDLEDCISQLRLLLH